jgi:DinB superfamily
MTALRETLAPAWSARLAFELSANDQTAQALAAGLTEEQLNWQPALGSWSVGQCLEHLCRTNEAYLKSISAALKDKPDSPVEQITPGWFGRWFIRSFAEPSPNSKRVSAPPKIRPAAHVELAVLDRFLSANKSCRELIVRTRGKNINRIRFWNPFVPGIRFTVGTGLEIVTSHERRHLLQAERVRDSVNFPRQLSS